MFVIINLRLADINDIDALYELNELFNGIGCSIKEIMAESIRNNNQETVFIAAAGDIVIGFLCVQLFKSMCYNINYAEITELFIREEYRRQGAATELMNYAEEYFKSQNICGYQLFTGACNKTAQAFYEKMGYIRSDEMMYRKKF